MNGSVRTRLYNLLPELYRWRDEQQGKPLQAFLSILENELHVLEVDMEAMYDNWFIQTCDNWVVPYLADLLGIRDEIVQIDYLPFTQRRRVANTLAYRRRKGTVAVLEQVLWDVTNWHVRAVEFYKLLSTTQHLQHLQADQPMTVNLKEMATLASLASPFSLVPRSCDTRTVSATQHPSESDAEPPVANKGLGPTTGGQYNPHHLGLFFWRLRPYPVQRGFPKQHATQTAYFSFSPTGHDTQLFNRPRSLLALEQRASAVNMPILVTRSELAADLSHYRREHQHRPIQEQPLTSSYYGPERSFNMTDIREIFLFDHVANPEVIAYLNREIVTEELRQLFAEQQLLLSQDVSIRTVERDQQWQLADTTLAKGYRMTLKDGKLALHQTSAQLMPSQLISADLRDWPSFDLLRGYYGDATDTDRVVVDPELGRFVFLASEASLRRQDSGVNHIFRVDYTYGFSADVGGGPYPRHFALPTSWESYCEILVAVGCQNSQLTDVSAESKVLAANSIGYALVLWNRYCEQCMQVKSRPRVLIHILDNGIYDLAIQESNGKTESAIRLPASAELSIVAEDGVQPTLVGETGRLVISFQPPVASVKAAMTAFDIRQADPSIEEAPVVDRKLLLSGLRMVGELQVEAVGAATETGWNPLNALDLVVEHCTILEGGMTVDLEVENAPALALTILRTIVGPLRVPANVAKLQIAESIVDCQLAPPGSTARDPDETVLIVAFAQGDANRRPGPPIEIDQSTFFGAVAIEGALIANVALFTGPVTVKPVDHEVTGLLRYCYLPEGSAIPAAEHCLYEGEAPPHCRQCVGHIARPVFSTRRYGRPGYAQLSNLSAAEILYGVGNIAEIGVFHHLYQPQRETNIQVMLEEYMPLGLDAGVFHVT
jgi:hypothetical protein